ncbi:MAG: PKD domain-containing protein [Bacteroidota bacterium]
MHKNLLFPVLLAVITLGLPISSFANTIIVTVGPANSLTFSPNIFSCTLGDTVKWVWATGSHTTTSTTIPGGAAPWDQNINSASTSFMYIPTVTGTYNYQCTPHASFGMTGSFTVNPCTTPSPATITGHLSRCNGITDTLTATTISGGITYQWKLNNSIISGATNQTLFITASGNYSCTVHNSCDSATSLPFVVTYHANPTPGITYTHTGLAYNFTLTGIPLAAISNISWDFGDSFTSPLTNPPHTYAADGTYLVMVMVTDTFGCSGMGSINLNTLSINEVYLPGTISISPNPAANYLRISSNDNLTELTLHDLTGRLVRSFPLSQNSNQVLSFDISDIPVGLYIIHATGTYTNKFEKLRILR